MTAMLLMGNEVARPIREEICGRAEKLREQGWTPCLASLEIGKNPASEMYVRNQERTAAKLGIEFVNRTYSQTITQDELLATIRSLNVDPRITGIILQRPVPSHIDLQKAQMAISPAKDVEGMHPTNIGKVVYNDYVLGPCTSLASVALLRATGVDLRGLDVVVVGHSEIVGKPIALHLLAALSTVTVCHHGTRVSAAHTRRADALFVAVGKAGLITADMVKPNAIVIDIGINQVQMQNEQGELVSRTVGDVDYENVRQVAGWITPVPGGVGPMTLTYLFHNVVSALEQQKQNYEMLMKIDH